MDLKRFRMKKYDDSVTTKIGELAVFNLSGMYYEELLGKFSPFAPSGSNSLNFKLPIESSTQSQPLQDILL